MPCQSKQSFIFVVSGYNIDFCLSLLSVPLSVFSFPVIGANPAEFLLDTAETRLQQQVLRNAPDHGRMPWFSQHLC